MAAERGLSAKRQRALQDMISAGLLERGVHGRIELQPSGLRGRYRLVVIASEFAGLAEEARQDLVWLVLKERWPREDQFRLTLTLCLSENEAPPARRHRPA